MLRAMNITMYSASVPTFVRQLKNASSWLDKAAAWATERKISQTTLLRDRLAPDMLPLYLQFFIAADHAKGCVARLSGVEAPKFEDGEPADFAAIKDRLHKTLAFVESVAADQIEGTEDKAVVVTYPGAELKFDGYGYLTTYAMPNFMFHATTAYAILRHNGVPLGKQDFLVGGGR